MDRLVKLLSKLNHLYKFLAGQNTDLTTIKMKDFIGDEKVAFVCILKYLASSCIYASTA